MGGGLGAPVSVLSTCCSAGVCVWGACAVPHSWDAASSCCSQGSATGAPLPPLSLAALSCALLPVTPSGTLMEVYLDHRRGGKRQEPRVTVLDSNLSTPWDACLHFSRHVRGTPRPPLLTPTPTVLTEPGVTRNDLKKETFGSSLVA